MEGADEAVPMGPGLLDYVTCPVTVHAKAYVKRLEAVVDDYEYVTKSLRKRDLPEVLAAMLYQSPGTERMRRLRSAQRGTGSSCPRPGTGRG